MNTAEIFELRNGCYTGMQQLSYVVVSPRPQCLLSYNKTQTSSLQGLWCMPCIRVTLEDIITHIYLFPRYLSSKNTGLIFYFLFYIPVHRFYKDRIISKCICSSSPHLSFFIFGNIKRYFVICLVSNAVFSISHDYEMDIWLIFIPCKRIFMAIFSF